MKKGKILANIGKISLVALLSLGAIKILPTGKRDFDGTSEKGRAKIGKELEDLVKCKVPEFELTRLYSDSETKRVGYLINFPGLDEDKDLQKYVAEHFPNAINRKVNDNSIGYTFYFPDNISLDIKTLYRIAKRKDSRGYNLGPSTPEFLQLVRKEFAEQVQTLDEEEFIANETARDSRINYFNWIIDEERLHEKDKGEYSPEEQEERAFLKALSTPEREYFKLADLIYKSEFRVEDNLEEAKRSIRNAASKIREYFDRRMQREGVANYLELTREQIRTFATAIISNKYKDLLPRNIKY